MQHTNKIFVDRSFVVIALTALIVASTAFASESNNGVPNLQSTECGRCPEWLGEIINRGFTPQDTPESSQTNSISSSSSPATSGAPGNHISASKQQVHYEPKITPVAATVGIITAQLAEKKFGTTKKNAFFAGIATTSLTSVGCKYAQHVHQQNNLDYTTVFTQWAIDTSLYCLSTYLINYVSCAKTKQTKSGTSELLNNSSQQSNTQAEQPNKAAEKPVITVPAAAFSVPSLWKKNGTSSTAQ